MKTKSRELDKTIKQYILDQITDNRDGVELVSNEAKITFIKRAFESEYSWRVDQVGRQQAMTDWLQGLALPIAYMNVEILELAKKWGSLDQDASEREEDKLLDNYWRFMAIKVLQLVDGYRVPKD